NTGFANAGDLNTGSFNTGSGNLGSFNLADSQGREGITFPLNFPAIPIDLIAGANLAIPIDGQFDTITIQKIPQFEIPVHVSMTVTVVILPVTIEFFGTQLSPAIPEIKINPIELNNFVVGGNVQIPFQTALLGQLNLTAPGLLGVGNSSGTLSSGYFNGNSSGTSGFFNSSDFSSGFANANGALTSGWYNSGSLLSGWQNIGNAISGFANTSTLAANAPALISGFGNIGSQVSGFLHGQMTALQATLADWVAG
ncbi:pentapeptide repeat-containing protein, partial [Mycobacterium asiaticum]|uniref:pentapeptide repeat-containing protein n=1 Tax=Mycobacterium asiaticum TaxID=1790 RepID=UPI0009BD36D4